jgi:DNA-binding MarR family transcriptional regulator
MVRWQGAATERNRFMDEYSSPDLAVQMLREVIVALVRRDGPALSAHQLAVYLTCYLKLGDHTVRGLAADLNVSKSVITRSLDKLGEMDLTRRAPDPSDRRSILVERTTAGERLLTELREIVVQVAHAARQDVRMERGAAFSKSN